MGIYLLAYMTASAKKMINYDGLAPEAKSQYSDDDIAKCARFYLAGLIPPFRSESKSERHSSLLLL